MLPLVITLIDSESAIAQALTCQFAEFISLVKDMLDEFSTLRELVREVRQTPNGFALRFDAATENLMAIADFIEQERLCCRFLRFQLIVEPETSPFWLDISGASDITQFLLAMFNFDGERSDSLSI